MADAIQFETPENIQVAYRAAGLGTRFQAWVVDQILLWLLMVVVFFLMIFLLAFSDGAEESLQELIGSFGGSTDEVDPEQIGYLFIGLVYLAVGLGSFLYFGLCELLMRGQTIGKRSAGVRVVKTDGFALDAPSIFVRNVFRVADQLPLLWIVPLLSSRCQRFGDMVAGTLVVEEGTAELPPVRAALAERSAADALHRFDASALAKLRREDADAIEKLLERWNGLDDATRTGVAEQLVNALSGRLSVEAPNASDAGRRRFLEDLLAAEYRRRGRAL